MADLDKNADQEVYLELTAAETAALGQLQAIKRLLSPIEKTLLGISDEDLTSFTQIEGGDIPAAVSDIVETAYHDVPAFRKMVHEDLSAAPNNYGRAAKLVALLLKHLKQVLPSDVGAVIHPNPNQQAMTIVRQTLEPLIPAIPAAEAKQLPEYAKLGPLNDQEFALFGLKPGQVTAETTGAQLDRPIAFFLGKLKAEKDGKTRGVKNEATEELSDEQRKSLIGRLLTDIRTKKIQAHGKLRPFEESWLGKGPQQLALIVERTVEPIAKTKDRTYQSDMLEVMTQSTRVLSMLQAMSNILSPKKFVKKGAEENNNGGRSTLLDELNTIQAAIEKALPGADVIEDQVRKIQELINSLDLTPAQLSLLTNVDTEYMRVPALDKDTLDMAKSDHNKTLEEIGKNGVTPELETKSKNEQARIELLESTMKKDTKALREAIAAYIALLHKHAQDNYKNLTLKGTGNLRTLSGYASELLLAFNRLAQEANFQLKWNRRGDKLFREQPAAPAKMEEVPTAPVAKTAADISEYSEKMESFFNGGPVRALQSLRAYAGEDSGLERLRDRLLSVIEASPDNPLNKTGKDFRGNPLAGTEPSLEDARKMVSEMKSTIRKFNPDKIQAGAREVLSWTSDLPRFVKAKPRAAKPAEAKPAETTPRPVMAGGSIVKAIRGFLSKFAEDVDTEQITTKAISDSGGGPKRGLGVRPTGKASWIIFRERLTKAGPKALPNYLEEPTFAREFIEQMESQGLNKMLLEGEKAAPVDIDKTVANIIGKGSGLSGDKNLENILGSIAMRTADFGRELTKAQKAYAEATQRIQGVKDPQGKTSGGLNAKIEETKKKYLPQILQYTQFLMQPIETVRDRIRARILQGPSEGRRKTQTPGAKVERKTYIPEDVGAHNISAVVQKLLNDYTLKVPPAAVPAGSAQQKPVEKVAEDMEAALAETQGVYTPGMLRPVLPSEMHTKALLDLNNMEHIQYTIEMEKDPLRRAQQLKDYYGYVLDVFRKHKEYVASEIREKIKVDQQTLANVEKFLASDAAKATEADPQKAHIVIDARAGVEKIRARIAEESTKLDEFVAFLSTKETPEAVQGYEKRLQEVNQDLEDGKVTQLYEVAEAPEMNLSKEEAELVKQRQRKKWQDVQTLTDIPTYKKNFETLSKKYTLSPGLKTPATPLETKVFPTETVALLRKKNEEDKKRMEEINRIIDEKNRLFQEKAFYEGMIKSFAGLEKLVKTEQQHLADMESFEQNFQMLQEHKSSVPEEEYKKGYDELSALFAKARDTLALPDNFEIKDLPQKVREEKAALKNLIEMYEDNKAHQAEYQQAVKEVTQQLSPTKIETPADLERRLQQLRVMKMHTQGQTGDVRNRRSQLYRIDQQMAQIENKLRELKSKTAAIEDSVGQPPASAFEHALETKGKMPSYMENIQRPKGWDVIREFYENSRKELHDLEDVKKKGIDWQKTHTEEEQQKMIARIEELEKVIPAIGTYMDQLVEIAGKEVPLKDTVERLDELLYEYLNLLRKYSNQRDDAVSQQEYMLQRVRDIEQFIDPETGKARDFSQEEKVNLKKIAFRMIYSQLDKYWSSRVGKNLSVFGERDTEWYDNVYRTFRNLVETRSNRKLINLLNKYKQETRSDFDDDVNRYKAQELQKRMEVIADRYQARGKDPNVDPEYQVLATRVAQLTQQQKQIDKIFTAMAQAVQAKVHDGLRETMEKEIGEGAPTASADLEKTVKDKVGEVEGLFDADITDLAKLPEIANTTEALLKKVEDKMGVTKEPTPADEPTPTAEPTEKVADYRSSKDYKPSVLYGPHMQRKIADMIKASITKNRGKA